MPEKKRFLIRAFGCQMNKLDAELVRGELLRAGYAECPEPDRADVVLYHTCSVRAHAENRVYSNVGKLKFLKRRRPDLVVGILGCMAQKDREGIFKRLPHVDIVCGTKELGRIMELIENARSNAHTLACSEGAFAIPERDISRRPDRHRAYVSVMRGCDNFCAYCIVPYVRGKETSRRPGDILEEVRGLAGDGCKEVTLLGQNVTAYGKSLGKPGALADVLEKVDSVGGIERVRFVTSHPKDMSRRILEAVRDLPTVCEYLHMPAQSGSDNILQTMRRGYTSEEYRALVALARELVPDIAIASDFIVGFPGETEADYERTAALVREMRFQNTFVFKYSPRPGTAASRLADDVPLAEKKRRNLELLEIQGTVNLEEHGKLIGAKVEVLVEGRSKRDARRMTGRLRTNRIAVFPGDDSLAGRTVKVLIRDVTALTLSGEVVGE